MAYNKNVIHEGAIKDIVDLILNDKFSNTFGKIFDAIFIGMGKTK